MIDAVITWSIGNRWLVIGASALLAILGTLAAWQTPVDAIPDLSENQVIVFTDWKGRSPREIEDQVTYPLALELQGMRGVRVVRSSSDVGFSSISVIFEDGVDFREGRRRVTERLARIRGQLPAELEPRLGPDSAATGQIFWYTVEGAGLDLGRLRAIQDWYVRPQLNSVPGVAEVASVGGFPIEYEIAVDPDRLSTLGVTLAEVTAAVSSSNATAAGHVLQKGNAEFVVRGVGRLGSSTTPGDPGFDPKRAISDLERVVIPLAGGGSRLLDEVARVSIAPGFRRGVLEKDGNEVTGGVVSMVHGENPLEVTRRIKAKIAELRVGLPAGVRIVPFYDRTPLIEGAIKTVTGTVVEAMISATICVVLVLLHLRTSFIIAVTLPLAAVSSFAIMAFFRWLGILDVQANAMSMAGIAISIGVLVDSAIVMAENVMHRLKERFGDEPVRGDVRDTVLPACLAVGRPIVFSVAIMLLSFVPVFALGGIEGKMFHPLAYTKSFALLSVAVLAITLVPALCTVFIRGRLRSELENPIVRSVVEVYRPVLSYLLDCPVVLVWIVGITFLVGFAPLGVHSVFLGIVFFALAATGLLARTFRSALIAWAGLLAVALIADSRIEPLARAFIEPLDEGMVMDMPISVPRASVTENLDDLKARDMVLCRFPEVDMVVGKGGRADTPTDPAPMDMIETMVNFRPREFWPRRKLEAGDARNQARAVLAALVDSGVVSRPDSKPAEESLVGEAVEASLPLFDAGMREYAYQRNLELTRESGGIVPSSVRPSDPAEAALVPKWSEHVARLNAELIDRGASLYTRILTEQILDRAQVMDPNVATWWGTLKKLRESVARGTAGPPSSAGHSHHGGRPEVNPIADPQPKLNAILEEQSRRFRAEILLWKADRFALTSFDGELDRAVQMPGWTNVWTMPIQNRVDMLATGVSSPIGIRVLGRNVDDVARASEEIAAAVKGVRGTSDVVADPIRGKPYVEIRLDRARAAELGVSIGEAADAIETALAGRTATTVIQGRERHPVVIRYPRAYREDEATIGRLKVVSHGRPKRGVSVSPSTSDERAKAQAAEPTTQGRQIPLSEVAMIGVVEGPATIKGENGLLRNYVRLNVRDRDAVDLVAEARQKVAKEVKLPPGVFLEWTGQFEHEIRSRQTLSFMIPVVVLLIFVILYWTYRDWADAALMLLAVPGAIAGGLFFQWLLGMRLSVTVWVGYIACFGMATSTGIIMLVYLREAVDRAGGLARLTPETLRQAVLNGAVQRLRPKLLTEGTVVIGLAPMLWSDGVASEIIRPMAAPVLGGVLVADEVIDLLLPVLFYGVRLYRLKRLQQGPPSPLLNGPETIGAHSPVYERSQ